MNNATLETMNAYKSIILKAKSIIAKSHQIEIEAQEKMWKDEITRTAYTEIYSQEHPKQELYNLVLKVACNCFIDTARNAIIEDMKSNPDKWTKTPLHFKKFTDLINTFLEPTLPTDSNGHTYFYRLDRGVTGARLTLCNYWLEYNNSESQILYRDSKSERLTLEEIEKATTRETIAPENIIKECKKALKDAEKIRHEYNKIKSKLDALKDNRIHNSAFYEIFPNIPYLR